MLYHLSDKQVWCLTALVVLAIIMGFGNALRAEDLDSLDEDSFSSDKKIYLIKDISTGSGIQPYFIYRSGDLYFYRNLQTGEGFKTLWVK